MLANINHPSPFTEKMSITHDNYSPHNDQYGTSYESDPCEQWMKWYKSTKETTKDIDLFFRLRADLEEEYANKLARLAHSPFGNHEKWALSGALKSVTRELENVANDHLQLASKIRSELQGPTKQAYENHKAAKSNIYKNSSSKLKDRDGYYFMFERAKERVLEFQQIGNDSARYGAEQELRLCQARLEESEHQYLMEKERIANAHRTIELNRIQFIRNILWRYTNLMSSTCVTDDESLEKIRRELEKCDSKVQVDTLIDYFQNGSHSLESNSEEDNNSNSTQLTRSLHEKLSNNSLNNSVTPERSSPLRNEIRKPHDPKLNQLVSSLVSSPLNETNSPRIHNNIPPATPIPNDRSKLISSDLVSATIARSPILAAKRSSTGSRPIARTPTIPSSLGNGSQTQYPSPNPSSTQAYDPMRQQYSLERSGSSSSKHSQTKQRSISPPDDYCASPNNLQRSFSTMPNQSYVRPNSHNLPHSQSIPPMHQATYSPASLPPNHPNYQHQMNMGDPEQRTMNISLPGYYSPAHPPNNLHNKSLNGTLIQPAPQFQMQPHTPRSNPPMQTIQQTPIPNNISPPNGTQSNNSNGAPTSNHPRPDSRPILFYVKAMYDYEAEIPEEISLAENQIVSVLATQLDGWWEGEIQDSNGKYLRGIFPSNFTEPVSL